MSGVLGVVGALRVAERFKLEPVAFVARWARMPVEERAALLGYERVRGEESP